MDGFGFGLFVWFMPLMAATLLMPLVITIIVIGAVVWAVRRNSAPREDPAVSELFPLVYGRGAD